MYDELFLEGYYDALEEAEENLNYYDDIENEIDFDNKYEDAYMEGYYDALNEIVTNPLPIIGGGDVKGDILAAFGLGNGPDRAAAIKNYFDNGGKIIGGLIGGEYGTKAGMMYRKNKFLPGSANTDIESVAANYATLFARLKPSDRKKLLNDLKRKYG